MVIIEGICKEVLDKTEWVAIATCGDSGPHIVATWGGYVKALGTNLMSTDMLGGCCLISSDSIQHQEVTNNV